ncbi:MAG: orotate phosphoribosyltransferase [Methylococcaceae bacterium]|nr:orotate phosphoribosyltransferase [Methylococcaceae bacterium]MCI0668651.1 orotate phosphoribosyltransferase [Methylococcaceae bacterium]MCI0733453.1 orotate phosphoribosyltransferase [Methylococcaceae bacterium]
MQDYQREFIGYSIQSGVLRFGEFRLNSGRLSPYFFNTGLFLSGLQLSRLGRFYAKALRHAGIIANVLYGPAYKGIPLVCTTAIALAEEFAVDLPFAFNRKEIKDHGEGGDLVGAQLQGSVLILDDVITAGTSIRESVEIIRKAGAVPCGVLIALDRQEMGKKPVSAVAEVSTEFNMPVFSIIKLVDIIEYLSDEDQFSSELTAIKRYYTSYGSP